MADNERTLTDVLRTLTHTQLRFVAARLDVNSDAEACRRVRINAGTKQRWENEADVDEAIRMSLIERVGVAMEILQRGAGEAAHALIDDVTHGKRHSEIRQAAARDVMNRVGVRAPEKIEALVQVDVIGIREQLINRINRIAGSESAEDVPGGPQ